MGKIGELLKNIGILAIGSFSSKILQFLLIPFYTRVLTDHEYGTIDILQTTCTLLIPIVACAIYEAIFRYTMDGLEDKKSVFSTGLKICLFNIFIFWFIITTLYMITGYKYLWLIFFYVATHILRSISSQFTRAIGKLKTYTADNVLNVLLTIITNIILLVVFKMGVSGYLIGYITGNVISIVFLSLMINIRKYISFKKTDKTLFKKLIKFSAPLIPGAVSWWVMMFSDRAMITATYGAATNGIYSLANKIPAIITIVIGVIFDAWQISANKTIDNKDASQFFSKIFGLIFSFVFLISCYMMPFSKFIIKIISGPDFWTAWKYMPLLLFATAIFSNSQFLGSIYTACKKTKMDFITNIIAATVNVILNFILIKNVGPIGAAVATVIAYAVLWISRIINTRRYIKIKYNTKSVILTVVLACIEVIFITLSLPYWQIVCIISIIIITVLNMDIFKEGRTIFKNIIKKP